MRLTYFSATNYRSITQANQLHLKNSTVLVGRNNEGKSNVLKGLAVAMDILQNHARRITTTKSPRSPRLTTRIDDTDYSWSRDFPVQLQENTGEKQTRFVLTFALAEDEVADFWEEIGSNLNGTLPIEIKIGMDEEAKIRVIKRGPGSKVLNDKSARITSFIAQRIQITHIPAIRTDQEAITIIRRMVNRELRQLDENEEYKNALSVIRDLQEPVLNSLAETLKGPLSEFVPEISDVKIQLSDYHLRQSLRTDIDVVIDDGTPTSIETKGDGVKSLAALALLKDRSTSRSGASIIAVEEPESHLHPAAIHQINGILSTLSESNQIIVTTHNPLFVDRADIRSNIIVDEGAAKSASSINEIRDLLGIRVSDNLTNSHYALVVEGEEDALVLRILLADLKPELARALRNGMLAIEPMSGAGNLSYKLQQLKNQLCGYHVFLDHDEPARNAYDRAENSGLIDTRRVTFCNCPGMPNSEIEDCYDLEAYRSTVKSKFGVDLKQPAFRNNKKWSERAAAALKASGKRWTARLEKELKYTVASAVADSPRTALNPKKRSSIDALASALAEQDTLISN